MNRIHRKKQYCQQNQEPRKTVMNAEALLIDNGIMYMDGRAKQTEAVEVIENSSWIRSCRSKGGINVYHKKRWCLL